MIDLSHLDVEAIAKEVAARLKADLEAAQYCYRCGSRCDSPYGYGGLCTPCASKPTGECMQIVINV